MHRNSIMRGKVVCCFTVMIAILLATSLTLIAAEPDYQALQVISIAQGAATELPVQGLKRFLVGAPNILTAKQTDKGLTLEGKSPGATIVAVWNDKGQESHRVTVAADAAQTLDMNDGSKTSVVATLKMTVQPGESRVVNGKDITRTSVSDPAVVDIVPVSPTEVLVNARKEGTATVRVWDSLGLTTVIFTVAKDVVSQEEVAAEVTKQIGIPGITARMVGESVVLSGTAPTSDTAQKAAQVAEALGRKVINLINVESVSADVVVTSLKAALKDKPLTYEVLPDQTVMIKGAVASQDDALQIQDLISTWIGTPEQTPTDNAPAQISFNGELKTPPDVVEKARTVAQSRETGEVIVEEDFNVARRVFGGRIPNGPRIVAIVEINPALAQQILVTAQVLEIDRNRLKTLGIQWAEIFGERPISPLIVFENRTPPVPLDEAGPFARNTLSATVKALINEGAARILSEPKILISDGHSANILVGGEIPIPVAQNANVGSVSITVVFKPFGIQLTVRPRVTPDGRILVTVGPEVSSLDFNNAVRLADFLIPALRTRRATTTVHMGNCESLAIGGLLSSEDVKSIDRIPLISKIPVIGELFKSRRFTRNETELIILVTPQIVAPGTRVPIAEPK